MAITKNKIVIAFWALFGLSCNAHINNISGALEAISKFRKKLIENPEEYKSPENAPDLFWYIESPKILYSKMDRLGEGGYATVSRVELGSDRSDLGLKKGDAIALRQADISEREGLLDESKSLYNFAKADMLFNKQISEFFPRFFGTYNFELDGIFTNFQEMELVDGTLAQEYNCGLSVDDKKEQKTISNCLILEFCLGEWSGAYYAGIGNQDAKAENAGFKKVSYGRTYKINGKEYAFSSAEFSPKRIDLGGAGVIKPYNENSKKAYKCSMSHIATKCKIPQEAKNFLDNLENGVENKTVFHTFANFYDSAKCSDEKAKEVRYFSWPE